MVPEFDNSVNWFQVSSTWASQLRDPWLHVREILDELDNINRINATDQYTANYCFHSLYCMYLNDYYKQTQTHQLIKKHVENLVHGDKHREYWAFITIGYDDSTDIDYKKMVEMSNDILDMDIFLSSQVSHEKYRLDGIHHHTHMLVFFKSKQYKSKVIDWIYQKLNKKKFKKYIKGKQSIDYKDASSTTSLSTYRKYIVGEKVGNKMECVEKDRQWRIESGEIGN